MSDLGIILPVRRGQLSRIGEHARLAEDRGFTGVFATEAVFDSLAVTMQAALATSRVSVGTAITNIYFRHPTILGSAVSHINEVSGGRMILGLGTSHRVINAPRGIDMTKPLSAMRGYHKEVRTAVWGDPPPKIYLGALRQGMTRLAGEETDGVMLNMIPLKRLPDWATALREGQGRRADGVVPRVGLFLGCAVDDDEARALEEARKGAAFYMRMEFYRNLMTEAGYGAQADIAGKAWDAGDEAAALKAVDDEMADQLFLHGAATTPTSAPSRRWRRADRAALPGVAPPTSDLLGGEESCTCTTSRSTCGPRRSRRGARARASRRSSAGAGRRRAWRLRRRQADRAHGVPRLRRDMGRGRRRGV